MDMTDEFPVRVRSLQADFAAAHRALMNWGAYSRDRAGFQRGITKSQALSQYRYNEEEEGYAPPPDPNDHKLILIKTDAPAKAEKVQDEPYDERAGMILCERIHGPGGLMLDARPVIRVAYVFRDVPEYQYPYRLGLLPDAVLERLEMGLRFAARFA